VRPGPAWRGLLLAPEAADWLTRLLPELRGAAATTPLARGARQLLVRHAADLHPPIFSASPASAWMRL